MHAALTADDEDDDEADEIAVRENAFGRLGARHARDLMDPFPFGDSAR